MSNMQIENHIPNEMQVLYGDGHNKVVILDKIRLIWCKYINYNVNTTDRIPLTFVNMMVLRALSLLKLFEGVKVPSCKEDILIVDIESTFTLLRSIYEEAIVFRNLFIYPETDEEKMILLNLWKIKGLLNRQNLENMPQEYKERDKRETDEIFMLKKEIRDLPEQIINQSGCKAIENYLDRHDGRNTLFSGYIFQKEGAVIIGGKPISFTRAPKEFLHCDELNTVLYRLLSLHSHPSYISVLQFQEIRPSNDYWDYAVLILRGFCLMMDIFISDFCKYKRLEVNVVSKEIQVFQK